MSAAIGCLLFATAGRAAERQVVRGHIPAAATGAKPLGRLPGPKQLNLAIGLPLRNQEELTNLLGQIYDPFSPNYHRYLTPDQFAERFGPTKDDYQTLITFAERHGLKVSGTHPNRTILDISGSVANIEKCLLVNLRVFQHPTEARTFYAPDVEPSLELVVRVLGITGLNDFHRPHPMNVRRSARPRPLNGRPYATGSGPRGAFIGKDFRAAYAPGVSLDGSGESIGLFELDGYYVSDITAYERLAGLSPVKLTDVFLNGVSGQPGGNNVEVALDIEMAISMAPGLARVLVYEGTTASDVLNRMATDNLARQLSSSWGFGPQVDPVREQIYMQFAAQGQSMFQASGDNGAYAGAIYPPSDDPFVTVVGGTALTVSTPGGAWQSETTWPGSGGGISTSYPIPTWQLGVDMTANQGSTTMRNIPDVAMHTDANIWTIVNHGEEIVQGGTSAATPLWAAFTALANQQAAAQGKPAAGFVNPAIYAIGKSPGYAGNFHDITTGNNSNGGSGGKFLAAPGYDLCTGWGTPTGGRLISALTAPPNALQIAPAPPVVSTGPVAGPFNPNQLTFTLTNTGAVPLAWLLVNTSAWLNASVTNGTLAAAGPATTVLLSLNSNASNLPAGSHTANLWFTNLNDQTVQSRQFTLGIVTPPLITAEPANQVVMEGATVSFSVGTSSNALMFYQWQYDNGSYVTNLTDHENISGSATETLTVRNVSSADVGAYSVVLSNAAGVAFSSSAFLTIVPWRPVIILQPASRALFQGETVTLSAGVIGSQPLSYRWQKGGTNLTDAGNLSGATSSSLTIEDVTAADAGSYALTVTNGLGSISSSNAVVTVASLNAPGVSLVALHSFSGGQDGSSPNALLQAADSAFYGTTKTGGSNSLGTVFRMTSIGSLSSFYAFSGGNDGANPFAALTQGPDRSFYGTAFQGGAYDNGTVFRISSNGVLNVLVAFNITNGDLPYAGLSFGPDGKAYGGSYQGGAFGHGSAYQVTTNGLLTLLHSFTGTNDGGFVYAGVLPDADGSVYGTTYKGGVYGYGTVFKTSTNGGLIRLVSFDSTNGSFPFAALAKGTDGNFYGATSTGGSYGNGTLFKMTPKGLFTNLYSFTGSGDGGGPAAALVESSDGNFYGTTAYGGSYGAGTVFRLAPNGALLTLVQFNGFDGANPRAALIEGTDGNLYGTTENGGAQDHGVIFRMARASMPPQITAQPVDQSVFAGATVKFAVSVFGSAPLYYQWRAGGTNLADGGNIFGAASRVLTISNAALPNAGIYSVVISNSLGGAASSDASLSVTSSAPLITLQPTNQTLAPGATAVLAVAATGNFPLPYQWQKNGTNILDGGNLTGAATDTLTLSTVTEANNGTYQVIVTNALGSATSSVAVVTIIPSSAPGTRLATLYSFSDGDDGGTPNGLAEGPGGVLYGTTQFGGAGGAGTLFSLAPDGALNTLAALMWTNGAIPMAGLAPGSDGNLYGTTRYGGDHDGGTLFRVTTNGLLTTMYSLAFDGGYYPFAGLVQASDGDFYGTTHDGGSAGAGTVFKITPDGAFTSLYSFSGGVDGNAPTAELVQAADGNFYGVSAGGANGRGNIFRMTPAGALTNLYSFTGGTDGSSPNALLQGADGNFYGTTRHSMIGSFQFYGTIFQLNTLGQLRTLYTLNFTDGFYPYAGLTVGNDGNFYGTTHDGGASGNGTLFRITPTGTIKSLVSFDGFNDGAHPAAALVQSTDGNLYGTTTSGGWGGQGTVFRLAILSAPVFRSITKSNATITLTWTAIAGQKYQLQFQSGLNSPGWSKLGGVITATTGTAGASDVAGADAARFYRVILLP